MEYTTIGESCSVVSGGTPSRSKNEYWRNGTIPWMKIGNIKSKYVNEYDELITEQGLNNSSAKLLKKGTILYTIFATLGEVGILDIEACTNQAIAGININDPRITTDYLYYYLKSKKDYVNNIGRGVAQNNINLTTLKKFEIPLINVDKQLNIVEILEKVERMIDLKKKEIDDLDLLIKARFVEMFGSIHDCKIYPYTSTKNLCDVISGGTPSREKSEYWEKGDIPWIRTAALQNEVITESIEYITKKGLDNSSAKLVPPNTILIAMYGQGKTRGMTGYLNIEASTNQACACILPGNKINPVFMWKYYELSYEKLRCMAKGGNQPNLNGNMIKDFLVLLPPMELQNEFVNFVKQVDKSKLAVQKSLEKTQQLFDSLMQEYFG